MPRRRLLPTLAAAMAMALALVALAPTGASPAGTESLVGSPGPIVIETIEGVDPDDPEIQATVAGIVEQVEAASAALAAGAGPPVDPGPRYAESHLGGIQVRYAPGGSFAPGAPTPALTVPTEVRTVIDAAADDWSATLAAPVPTVIDVYWVCFNDYRVLGYAGPADTFAGANLPTGHQYPVALVNQLTGADANGATPEVFLVLNADLAASGCTTYALDAWHISISTAISGDHVDLYSVVLHELGHGLGFLGSAWNDPFSGLGLESPPFVYDASVRYGTSPLLGLADPAPFLTSGNLFHDIGGGRLWRVYAPPFFENGSSFSHFDTTLVGQPGQLMTPALGSGEIRRTLDAPILGVLRQQGWSVNPRAVTPSITSLGATATTATVSWSPGLGAYGLPPTSYRVTAAADGTTVAATAVTGATTSATLTGLRPGTLHTISVVPYDSRGAATGDTDTIRTVIGAPRLVRSDGIGLTRTVTWQVAPSGPGSGTVTYTAQYRVAGTPTWKRIGSTTALSIATPPLAAGRYQFRVRAADDFGNGPWGLSTIIGVSATRVRPFPLDGQVARLYEAYLLRPPDQTGYDYWMEQRASGRSLASISAAFAASDEFTTRYGSLTNSAFVDLVYQNVVGRSADDVGFAFWTDYLNQGNNRGSLMIGFSESGEYIGQTGTVAPTTSSEGKVYRLYLAFFQREPDAGGLAYWVGRLDGGLSLGAIADQFAASPEFAARYGATSNRQFIELIYANVLIRNPDTAGLNFWTGQLDGAGRTRGQVMVGFSESVEFIIRTGAIP